MTNESTVFVYDDDGLFEIVDIENTARLSGGIQSSIGSAGSEEQAGFFCHNKDSCK